MKYVRKHIINEDYVDSYDNNDNVIDDEIDKDVLEDIESAHYNYVFNELINIITEFLDTFNTEIQNYLTSNYDTNESKWYTYIIGLKKLSENFFETKFKRRFYLRSNIRKRYMTDVFDYLNLQFVDCTTSDIESYTPVFTIGYKNSTDKMIEYAEKLLEIYKDDPNLLQPKNYLYIIEYIIVGLKTELEDLIRFRNSKEYLRVNDSNDFSEYQEKLHKMYFELYDKLLDVIL